MIFEDEEEELTAGFNQPPENIILLNTPQVTRSIHLSSYGV